MSLLLKRRRKLLIQQISCYVPLQHLRNGQIGCKGHVCCFEQDINEVCTILPMISIQCQNNPVIKQYRKENADIESLHFLSGEMLFESITLAKKHSIEYQDITIQESNLDWISDGIEQDLPPCNIELEAEDSDLSSSFQDQGPSISQQKCWMNKKKFHLAYYMEQHRIYPNKDAFITNSFNKQQKKPTIRTKKATINFPYVSQTPVSEYDTNSGLFSKAFPWLFQVEE
jgi:hypothetical protein